MGTFLQNSESGETAPRLSFKQIETLHNVKKNKHLISLQIKQELCALL